jgi:hypothetical protein
VAFAGPGNKPDQTRLAGYIIQWKLFFGLIFDTQTSHNLYDRKNRQINKVAQAPTADLLSKGRYYSAAAITATVV